MESSTAREQDHNGYLTIKDNPITRAGVFQYKGSQLPDADPERIYNVYRPLEELQSQETLDSFIGLPILNEHEMVGDRYERGPEERGVHGSILEGIRINGKDVLANIRIWSRTLKSLLEQGKKGLSLGYNCFFEKSSGVFENMTYDYIQRNIRGNHLALVNQGRSGTAVLDKHHALDEFDLVLDNEELDMADENDDKKPDNAAGEAEKDMTLSEAVALLKTIVPQVQALTSAMENKTEEVSEIALDGDTEKKDGDQKKEDKAMDSADIEKLIDSRVKSATAGLLKNSMAEATKRDALAKDLVPHIGSFDCSAMDSNDVAVYGAQKLELNVPKGQEYGAVSGFLAAAKKNVSAKTSYALDSVTETKVKEGGKLAARLNNAA